jgi:hypothetical protein
VWVWQVVHASLLHLRTELRSVSEQLEVARRSSSASSSSTSSASSSASSSTATYPGRVASARVHALRAAHPHPLPLPPLEVRHLRCTRTPWVQGWRSGSSGQCREVTQGVCARAFGPQAPMPTNAL